MMKFRAAWLAPALIVFAAACSDGEATAEEGAAEAANPCAVEAMDDMADDAAEGMGEMADDAAEGMGEMADDAGDAAHDMVDDAEEAADDMVDEGEAANPCG